MRTRRPAKQTSWLLPSCVDHDANLHNTVELEAECNTGCHPNKIKTCILSLPLRLYSRPCCPFLQPHRNQLLDTAAAAAGGPSPLLIAALRFTNNIKSSSSATKWLHMCDFSAALERTRSLATAPGARCQTGANCSQAARHVSLPCMRTSAWL